MGDIIKMSDIEKLVEIKALKKYFPIEKGFMHKIIGYVKAVDNINLYIAKNETLGLVGESGCGKTTLGRCILRALEPTDGEIYFYLEGDKPIDFMSLKKDELKNMRRYMQMIFQNPYSSLDPRMTVLDIIAEPMRLAGIKEDEVRDRVKQLIVLVGLEVKHLYRYPHAFSGGQRQRIGIARALALNPLFVVADECVSALDVSVRAQILNLLQDVQKELGLSYLFIAHDLSVVEYISDRVGVMYVGKLVELAKTEELFLDPKHPYTEALMAAIPIPDPQRRNKRMILQGEVANAANLPSGCCFHPRCRYAQKICKEKEPALEEVSPGHFVACHYAEMLELAGVENQI
jgi:peptide/nickel transport system ATP-binding protein